MRITRRNLVLAATASAALPRAWAPAYPGRTVRVVVPYPAGSALEVVARMFAEGFQPRMGQPAIVVNMPGGAAAIGTRHVAQAEPDGHTLLLGTNQTHGANSALIPNLGYDALKDFQPIAGVGRLQHALLVRKDLGVGTLREFIALARQPGRKLNYGSSGNGSASHLAAEMFKQNTGVEMAHIPYNGSSQATQAILGGHIDATFTTLPSVLGFIRSGGAIALAIASRDRAPQIPDVRTLAEQGVPNSEADAWTAFFAPARTPPAVLESLTRFAVATFSAPAAQQKLSDAGFVPDVRPAEAFRSFLVQDMKRWADIIKSANVKLD